MTSISAAAVQSLRLRTGVSILACKNALEEANGDEEAAIELLRKRGIAQAAKAAVRAQSQGRIFLAEGTGKLALLLIRCETDFVARADGFGKLGDSLAQELLNNGEAAAKAKAETVIPAAVLELGENISVGEMYLVTAPTVGGYLHSNAKVAVAIGMEGGTRDGARDAAMHAAAMNPTVVSPTEVSEELVAKEREIWREQLAKEGKPEAMFDKIMLGKEKKFREESALLTQPFVKDPSQTVGQFLGENTKVTTYVRLVVA
jgi:elongation factor Ts